MMAVKTSTLLGSICICLGALGSISSCVHDPASISESQGDQAVIKIPEAHGQPHPAAWFAGSVAAAFDEAAARNKLVFLYWGAVWCPPCNELKANVFTHPEFPRLMQNVIPVYLDGDSVEAQTWGDTLGITGYPTMLVLDAHRQELLRVNSSLSFAEFSDIIHPLTSLSQTFDKVVTQVEQGRANPEDWRLLAYADWEQLPAKSWPMSRRITALKLFSEQIPQHLVTEKALLAAQWLGFVANAAEDSAIRKQWSVLARQAPSALDAVFASPLTMVATRSFINNQVEPIVDWLYPEAQGVDYQGLRSRWILAAKQIEQDAHVSIDNKLWAVYPGLAFYRREHPKGQVPLELKQRIQAAVRRADDLATNAYARHAVISGAASLLRLVDDPDGARALLTLEAAKSDTPWYYYSSLAGLAQEQKQPQEAKKWLQKARQSAQGRATRIQWITSDIAFNAKLKGSGQKEYLLGVTKEFYALATELSDGFAGRNARRAEMVGESLMVFRHDPDFILLFKDQRKRCAQLLAENQRACFAHFAQLM